ncbi:MAG: methyltransferase [Actinomycetes bacterium]
MTQDNQKNSHYFTAAPAGNASRHRFTVAGPHGDLIIEGASGVFSQHGLDKGTGVLLDTMRKRDISAPVAGSALCDVGCGSGVIAITLAALYPQCTVYAVDVNERARALCADNACVNKLANIVVCSPDDIDPNVKFALIWSNPPIRIGKDALHELLNTWLGRLNADGAAHLVVSKNLGADSLQQWMESHHFSVERLGSSKGFRVFEVTPPLA